VALEEVVIQAIPRRLLASPETAETLPGQWQEDRRAHPPRNPVPAAVKLEAPVQAFAPRPADSTFFPELGKGGRQIIQRERQIILMQSSQRLQCMQFRLSGQVLSHRLALALSSSVPGWRETNTW